MQKVIKLVELHGGAIFYSSPFKTPSSFVYELALFLNSNLILPSSLFLSLF